MTTRMTNHQRATMKRSIVMVSGGKDSGRHVALTIGTLS